MVRCVPNRLGGFYSLLSLRRKELIDGCIFQSFFKCKQGGMSGVLTEYLLDYYQAVGTFKLNKIDVKMGLKDMALI